MHRSVRRSGGSASDTRTVSSVNSLDVEGVSDVPSSDVFDSPTRLQTSLSSVWCVDVVSDA